MKNHIWKFTKCGGVTQLVLETADDLLHLKELDQKLWTVLAMPTKGIFFDYETAEILDLDNDNFIRPPEILQAIDFLDSSLHNISIILTDGTTLSLKDIKDKVLLQSAQWCIARVDNSKQELSLAEVQDIQKTFLTSHEPEELLADDTEETRLKKILWTLIRKNPEATVQEILTKFNEEKDQYVKWSEDLHQLSYGITLEQMQQAMSAFDAVQKKIDDFFVRCTLLEYDPHSQIPLTDYSEVLKPFARETFDEANEVLRSLPISIPCLEKRLDLQQKINPSWINEMRAFYAQAVLPLLGEFHIITESDWKKLSKKIFDFKEFYKTKTELTVGSLSVAFLKNVPFTSETLEQEIQEYIVFEKQKTTIQLLKKLLLLRTNFFTLLKNYVSFSAFYSGEGSVFQAGVLFFDARSAHLCFELSDDTRHATLDILSGAYLVYCEVTRYEKKRNILALLTNGISDTVVVGRNGLFYDRDGNDWNATVTKVLSNPVSVTEAFFTPYKNIARMIEDQIAKKASNTGETTTSLLSSVAEKANAAKEGSQPAATKKLDLGTIALIGTAVGGISTLIGSLLQVLFGLGFWVPLGLLGLLLIISGPSMLLAAMKLRKRSIAPILEANGWAINVHARINIPFGHSLTKLLTLPKNSRLIGFDKFADKKSGKRIIAVLCLILVLALTYCYFAFIKNLGVNPLMWFRAQ
ncbi:MAG: hypothetical protein IJU92_06735 [Spirochaetaceae bacterium]|nr:hypothetical protein [Spirochaetaceae bacterium]